MTSDVSSLRLCVCSDLGRTLLAWCVCAPPTSWATLYSLQQPAPCSSPGRPWLELWWSAGTGNLFYSFGGRNTALYNHCGICPLKCSRFSQTGCFLNPKYGQTYASQFCLHNDEKKRVSRLLLFPPPLLFLLLLFILLILLCYLLLSSCLLL